MCGYTCAAEGDNHAERCLVVLKIRCVIDEKICMPQRKMTKTVIALEKKKDMFFIINSIAYQKRRPYVNGH